MGSTFEPLLLSTQSHGFPDISVGVEAGPSYSPNPQIVQYLRHMYHDCVPGVTVLSLLHVSLHG